MATFRERAIHSDNCMFALSCLFVASVVSHLGFKGGTLVLIGSVPGHCFLFSFFKCDKSHKNILNYKRNPTVFNLP